MDIKLFILLILFLCFLITITIFIIKPYLDKKISLKEKEIANDKYNILSRINAKAINDELDNWILNYIAIYVLENITSQGEEYIVKDKIESMIKTISKQCIVECSELYLYYIKLLVDISNDDDLTVFLYKKVRLAVLAYVTDFNQTKE